MSDGNNNQTEGESATVASSSLGHYNPAGEGNPHTNDEGGSIWGYAPQPEKPVSSDTK